MLQDVNTMIPASQEFAIETTGLKKVYQRGSQSISALEQLDLRVPKHSIFGFLGPNGAGKTTTMKLLLGLTRPSSGSIQIFGKDLHQNLSIRTRIGYMPQSPRFYPHLTARQTLRFSARFYPQCRTSQLDKRIDEMLTLVGLESRADRPVGGFSGGERQRLGLAQAQIHQPDLLILDEPAAALDPVGRNDVLRIMDRLREQATIFYSTHILDDVQQVSDTVAILKHGKLVAQGSIHSLLSTGETVYQLQFKGPAEPTYTRLMQSDWVQRVETLPYGDPSNEHQEWQIFVIDEQAAQAGILPLLNNGQNVQLIAFFRKKVELEQVFLDLVQGEPV